MSRRWSDGCGKTTPRLQDVQWVLFFPVGTRLLEALNWVNLVFRFCLGCWLESMFAKCMRFESMYPSKRMDTSKNCHMDSHSISRVFGVAVPFKICWGTFGGIQHKTSAPFADGYARLWVRRCQKRMDVFWWGWSQEPYRMLFVQVPELRWQPHLVVHGLAAKGGEPADCCFAILQEDVQHPLDIRFHPRDVVLLYIVDLQREPFVFPKSKMLTSMATEVTQTVLHT